LAETALTITQPKPDKPDLASLAVEKGIDLAKTAISSPLLSMVIATCAIEALQGVYVWKGKTQQIYKWDPIRGGYNETRHIDEPLISQALATTLEGVIITAKALEALDLASIAKLFGTFAK